MFPVTRFKFDNENQATNPMIALFGTDELVELITKSRDHSVTMVGSPTFHTYDEEGEIVDSVTKEGFHVNVVTREPLDVTDNVIEPLTPWFKVQGE